MAYRDDWRYPTGLIVHTGPKVFARAIQINSFDPDSFKVETFSQDVVGILTSETVPYVMLDDEEITTESARNDYYGLLTCIGVLLGSPEKPKNPLYKIFKTNIHLEYYYRIPDEELRGCRQAYLDLPKDWYEIGRNSLQELDAYFSLPQSKRGEHEFEAESLYISEHIVSFETRSDKPSLEILDELHNLVSNLEERFPDGDWDIVRINVLEGLKNEQGKA